MRALSSLVNINLPGIATNKPMRISGAGYRAGGGAESRHRPARWRPMKTVGLDAWPLAVHSGGAQEETGERLLRVGGNTRFF